MKKILIIHPEGNVNNNPTLYAFMCSLRSVGIDCDITVSKKKVKIKKGDIGFIYINDVFRKIKKGLIDYVGNEYVLSAWLILKAMAYKKKYKLIIGVDREGLVEAWIISKLINVPFVFFSFEMIFRIETSEKYKKIEKKASANVGFCLIQDKLRGQQMTKENGISEDKMFYLPVAGKGLPKIIKGKRLRDELGVPRSKKVVAFMGSVSKWTMFDEVIKNVVYWPDEWVLLVHSRYGNTASVVQALTDVSAIPKDKFFMTENVCDTNDDLGVLLNGVSLGLALYDPDYSSKLLGLNLKYIGMSSGKIATFLRYGVPVIINELNSWEDIVKKNAIGKVIKKPSDIARTLNEIDTSEMCSDKCRKYFLEKLDYGIYEKKLLKKINFFL